MDQLPPLVMDAFQVVDMFRQDPTKTNLEEKKMVSAELFAKREIYVSKHKGYVGEPMSPNGSKLSTKDFMAIIRKFCRDKKRKGLHL